MFANRFPPSRLLAWGVTALSVASFGAASLDAQEVRTTDGRVLVGKVQRRGDEVLVDTRFGTVSLRKEQIESERDQSTLMREFTRFEEYSERSVGTTLEEVAQRQLDLAELASRFGLEKPMWRALSHLVRAREASDGAFDVTFEDSLDRFLPTLETFIVDHRVLSVTPRKRVRALLIKTSKRTPQKDLVVARALAMNPELVQEAARSARQATSPHMRQVATESIALHARMLNRAVDRKDHSERPADPQWTASTAPSAVKHAERIASAEQFVVRTALTDTSPDVRNAAARFTRTLGKPAEAARFLGSYLQHPTQLVRIRTAEALGDLGVPAAIDVLVQAGPTATANLVDTGTPGTRANVSITQQQSYVRDYDVEVASGAFIADPVVDILQSGVVLDVTVLAVTTERVVTKYRNALKKLSGSDPGPVAGSWAAWLRQLKASRERASAPDVPEKR